MNTIRILWLAPFALLGSAAPVNAQAACDGRVVGTLGITSFECRDCSFSSNPAGLSAARFGTEPRILEVDTEASEGDDLANGDVIVAVNGNLITTSAGVEALTSLRPGQDVRITVRRRNGVHAVDMVAGEACIPRPPAPPPAVAPTTVPRVFVPPSAPTPMDVRAPAAAPAPPMAFAPPGGSLGFAFSCSECALLVPTGRPSTLPLPLGTGIHERRWIFPQPPVVHAVDRNGAAWAAGLRAGDELIEIDGVPLTTEDGGRRMANLAPNQTIELTTRRDGVDRKVALKVGLDAPRAEPPAPPFPMSGPPAPAPERTLRYTGTIGDTSVEVRGSPVTVSEDRATGEIIIRSADLEVRLKRDRR